MEKRIITISRQFGSGGRTIGRELARRLGVPCYDKELVKRTALETGFDEGYIEQAGEYAPVNNWLSYLLSPLGTQGAMGGMSAEDFLWAIQRRVILDLAEKGPCVIVGRCADYILKDREDCFHVFLHAGRAFRARRILRQYGRTEQTAERRLEDKDRKRRLYCRRYTGREWGMAEHYHLALDSGLFGVDGCVDAILRAAGGGPGARQPGSGGTARVLQTTTTTSLRGEGPPVRPFPVVIRPFWDADSHTSPRAGWQ